MLFKYKIERNQRHSASSTGKIGDPEYRKKKKKPKHQESLHIRSKHYDQL